MSAQSIEPTESRPAETVAGFIAAAALAVGAISVVYRPVRLYVPALIIALVAVGIGGRHSRAWPLQPSPSSPSAGSSG